MKRHFHRALLKTVQGLIIGATVIVVLLVIGVFYPPLGLLQHLIVGTVVAEASGKPIRADMCTVWDHYGAWRIALRRKAVEDRVRIVGSDPRGFDLYDTPLGPLWAPKRNAKWMKPQIGEIATGVYDGIAAVRSGDIVLDCGANIGAYTRHAVQAGAKLVVAIDIMPENVEALRWNFEREIKEGRVIVYPKGVWDTRDLLPVYEPESDNSIATSMLPLHHRAPSSTVVQLTTIDNIVEELALSRVDVIKFDIEGAESRALRGAERTVARYQPRMAIAMEHAVRDLRDIPAQIQRQWPSMTSHPGSCEWVAGYDTTWVQPHVMFAHAAR